MSGYYRWDDVGAPTLNGTAGSFIDVLDHVLVTGQGWSKVYSGTNKAVYRAPAGNQLYLRVDATGTTSVRLRGYETMSDVDTGTGPFPTDAQISGGAYFPSADSTSSTGRQWVAVANDRFLAMWSNPTATGTDPRTNGCAWCFGDILSYQSPDAYGAVLIANNAAGITSNMHLLAPLSTAAATGHYAARAYTGSGSSIGVAKTADHLAATSINIGSAGQAQLPNPAGNGVLLSPIRIHEAGSVMRGVLPGVWAPSFVFSAIENPGVITGSGELAGKTFFVAPMRSSSLIALETSNTW